MRTRSRFHTGPLESGGYARASLKNSFMPFKNEAPEAVEEVDSRSLFKNPAGKALEKVKPEAYLAYVRV
jgi:hypothetical protein